MNRSAFANTILTVVVLLTGCKQKAAPEPDARASGGSPEPAPAADAAVMGHSVTRDADSTVRHESVSAPPKIPFISNQEFPDCIHPGVERDCSDGWCRIPAGCFIYGSPDEEYGRARYDERQTRVTLSRDFEIQQTEVTQRAWLDTGWELPLMPPDVSTSHCEDLDCPVERTTWFAALRYANWMSERSGLEPCFQLDDCSDGDDSLRGYACGHAELRAPTIYECEGYRLPTSAEWEYAARAGTTTAFHSGPINTDFEDNSNCNLDPNLARVGWYCANIPNADTPERRAQVVAKLDPNAWGLHDVHGNVSEWVMDTHKGVSWNDPYPDPEGQFEFTGEGTNRSGSFFSTAQRCRSAWSVPVARDVREGGFRLARTLGAGEIPTIDDLPASGQAR